MLSVGCPVEANFDGKEEIHYSEELVELPEKYTIVDISRMLNQPTRQLDIREG
jgi:hypothetical protein